MSPNNTHAVVKTFGIFGELFLVAPTKVGCLWVVLHVLEFFREYSIIVGNSFSGIITICNSFSGICQNYFNFYIVLSKKESTKTISISWWCTFGFHYYILSRVNIDFLNYNTVLPGPIITFVSTSDTWFWWILCILGYLLGTFQQYLHYSNGFHLPMLCTCIIPYVELTM